MICEKNRTRHLISTVGPKEATWSVCTPCSFVSVSSTSVNINIKPSLETCDFHSIPFTIYTHHMFKLSAVALSLSKVYILHLHFAVRSDVQKTCKRRESANTTGGVLDLGLQLGVPNVVKMWLLHAVAM